MSRSRTLSRLASALLLLLLLSACSNSKLIIAPLYNRLDDRIRDEFHKLGDFDEAQEQAFEQAVGTFHVWHRQSELPRYADLLDEIAASIAVPEATTAALVQNWMQRVEARSMAARQCYPANFLTGMVRTLGDEQLDFIERRFARERRENRERYNSRTAEERVERRVENLDKWLGRAQLDLNTTQKRKLRNSLSRQTSLRLQYYRLTDQWNRQLFNIAREQTLPDYESRLQTHMASLWTLLEDSYPSQWLSNRELWQSTALDLISSLDRQQRRDFSQWLQTMATTLRAVSRDKPSFQVGDDPRVGCLVEQEARLATPDMG